MANRPAVAAALCSVLLGAACEDATSTTTSPSIVHADCPDGLWPFNNGSLTCNYDLDCDHPASPDIHMCLGYKTVGTASPYSIRINSSLCNYKLSGSKLTTCERTCYGGTLPDGATEYPSCDETYTARKDWPSGAVLIPFDSTGSPNGDEDSINQLIADCEKAVKAYKDWPKTYVDVCTIGSSIERALSFTCCCVVVE